MLGLFTDKFGQISSIISDDVDVSHSRKIANDVGISWSSEHKSTQVSNDLFKNKLGARVVGTAMYKLIIAMEITMMRMM